MIVCQLSTYEMWLKILCLCVILDDRCSGVTVADDLLSVLYGVNRRNMIVLCLRACEGRRERWCAAALLHDEWVGVSADCLRGHPRDSIIAMRDTDARTCRLLDNGYSTRNSRSVIAHYYHPWWNMALLMLNRPYVQLDVHPNTTAWTVSRVFKQHGLWRWMKKYMKAFEVARDPDYRYKRIAAKMISTRRPLYALLFSIIMPLLILVLVFYYVINYTGSCDKVPDNNLQCTKNSAQVNLT